MLKALITTTVLLLSTTLTGALEYATIQTYNNTSCNNTGTAVHFTSSDNTLCKSLPGLGGKLTYSASVGMGGLRESKHPRKEKENRYEMTLLTSIGKFVVSIYTDSKCSAGKVVMNFGQCYDITRYYSVGMWVIPG